MIYGKDAQSFVLANDGFIDSIDSKEGVQQGDVMAMWLYSLTIHPLVERVQDILLGCNSSCLNMWYADDGNVRAPFDLTCKLINLITESDEGKTFGYFLKLTKCKYLIGKYDSLNEAIRRKDYFLQLGFNHECVLIHPDNL